jgi:aryl-alcohol dehydrogenase-like predicted oxidoreductase
MTTSNEHPTTGTATTDEQHRGRLRTTCLGDGLEVPVMGLGAMGMSAFYGASDEAESIATLRHAVDRGVTFIDTAEAYGPFENERLIGRALGHRRDEVVLATKASAETDDDGTVHGRNGTPAYIRRAAHRSLRHLGTDVIDLYYLHRVDPDVPIEESVGAMAELVREGVVRHIGLSEASAATIRRAHAVHPLAAVQSELSLFARDVLDNGELATMRELGIGFVAFSPLGRGVLSDGVRSLDDLAPDDARRTLPRFQPDAFTANRRLVERVEAIAARHGATVAQVALAWVIAQGVVPIPGTRRRSRLDENIAAADLVLTDVDRAELEAALPAVEIRGHRDYMEVPPGADR